MTADKEIKCPSCEQMRYEDLSGSAIKDNGVCEYCLVALVTNSPLLIATGVVMPKHIAKIVVDFIEKKR